MTPASGRIGGKVPLGIAGLCLIAMPAAAQQARAPAPAQPQSASQLRMGSKPQELLFTKITVSDLARSVKFYTEVVGLKLVTSPDIDMPGPPAPGAPEADYAAVTLNHSGSMADAMLVLIKRRGVVPVASVTGQVIVGIKVPSTDGIVEAARKAGHPPTRPFAGNGSPAHIADPDGYGIELVQAKSFEARR